MKLTYSVKAVIRLDKIKSDGSCPIHFSLRVGPYTTRLSSGKSINPKDWDDKNNCPRKKDKYHQLLSTYLNKKTSGFETYMLTLESLGKPITLNVAMNYFRDNTKVTLFTFWEQQIDLWQVSKGYNTLKSYRSGLNIVRQFNPKLDFGDLTYDCIQKFDLFLSTVRHNGTGGKFTKHKILKAIINQAIMKGFMKDNPYKYFKIKAAAGIRSFLSVEEVSRLMSFEIAEKKHFLNKVRDLFLFSCFTGLRYSDVMNLKWDSIKEAPDHIELIVTKTGKPLLVPLAAKAKAIVEKYMKMTIKAGDMKVFPQMANQVINRELKVLTEVVGIKKAISFHCARHTFASGHLHVGTNIHHLKDLLGHSNLVQTQIYTKSLPSDLYKSMDNLNNIYSHAV